MTYVTDKNSAWDYLIESEIASEQTLNIVTSINGYSMDTMNDVLFAATGYRSFEQLEDES